MVKFVLGVSGSALQRWQTYSMVSSEGLTHCGDQNSDHSLVIWHVYFLFSTHWSAPYPCSFTIPDETDVGRWRNPAASFYFSWSFVFYWGKEKRSWKYGKRCRIEKYRLTNCISSRSCLFYFQNWRLNPGSCTYHTSTLLSYTLSLLFLIFLSKESKYLSNYSYKLTETKTHNV